MKSYPTETVRSEWSLSQRQSWRILDRSNTGTKIRNEREYKAAMKTIESLLNKATEAGGFHKLPAEEATMLGDLSKLAEAYEDNTLKLMPIVPKTLQEAVEFKMAEQKLTQAKLAKKLGIGAPKLSQILKGRREPDVTFLKAVHKKLK